MRGESGEYACAHAAVAIAAAIAKDRVGFVDHDDHRAERSDRHQDARQLTLRVSDPFAAKIAELQHGEAALRGEAIDEERFADAHAPRHEDAALHDIILS